MPSIENIQNPNLAGVRHRWTSGSSGGYRSPASGLVLFALLFFGILAGAQAEPRISGHWKVREGLPTDCTAALARTPDGYLWIGTDVGLVRFDGVRFVLIGPEHGLPLEPITGLHADRAGCLWIVGAYGRNKYLFKNGRAVLKPELRDTRLVVGGDGKVYSATRQGVIELGTGRPVSPAFPPLGSGGWPYPTRVSVLRSGRIDLLDSRLGFQTLVDGKWVKEENFEVSSFGETFEDSRGNLWLAFKVGAALRIDAQSREQRWLPLVGSSDGGINGMAETRKGELWASNWNGGLWRLVGEEFRPFPLHPNGFFRRVPAMVVDPNDDLWVCTLDDGLYRISDSQVAVHRIQATSGGDKITALVETEPGKFLVGTQGHNTFVWEQDASRLLCEDPDFHRYIYGNCLLKSRSGDIWLGTGHGLHVFRDGRWVKDPAFVERFDGDSVAGLIEQRDGTIWAGCESGRLYRVRDRRLVGEPVLIDGRLSCLALSPDGSIYAGGDGGSGLRRIREGDPLRPERISPGHPGNITALYFGRDGRLWIGTADAGLFVLENDRMVPVKIDSVGRLGGIGQIIEDRSGWLWLGTSNGIVGIDLSRLGGGIAATDTGTSPTLVKISDGMPSNQCTRMVPIETRDGQLCFGTTQGFVSFRPEAMHPRVEIPEAMVEEILINGELAHLRPPGRPVPVPPASRFEVNFTSLGARNPENLRFRYRLTGLGENWIDNGQRRFADFTALPPGDYRFLVQAGTPAGQWSSSSAVVDFAIQPYYWQTLWFKWGVGLCLAGLVGGGVLAVERGRQRHAAARARAVDQERHRISRDLHDGLGAGLAHATMLADTLAGEPQAASADLGERLRGLTRDLGTTVWMASPRHDRLLSLCTYLGDFSADFFRRTPIRCRFEMAGDLPDCTVEPQVRHHLFMVIKEAMSNTIKHSGASEAVLSIRSEAGRLLIDFEDNGNETAGSGKRLEIASGHHGCHHMAERIRELDGTFGIDREGRGYHIHISLPLPAKKTTRRTTGGEEAGEDP